MSPGDGLVSKPNYHLRGICCVMSRQGKHTSEAAFSNAGSWLGAGSYYVLHTQFE